ncbi:hypothetical protein BU24DRAFT_401916 [Aaosphaeria arxii CBS 175.79]|uniref:Peptidase S54 rhomboid domain-containing protein n=1 Tax=Aaosphaeria arxii CBS 175.79 TaxID=1450172 RepID=A0A6A5X8D8_9PLEO|nr:uncharacterized protein BU24DRAFT_401916 [Aaosphaeria arxii CBS 175.79]KAF2009212.1 hypothetical protein BU24DRAFT_401916 [Aaosphaeria arxii CBS 175.79]
MITSGFTNAPVSQFLVFATVLGALAASLTDTRYLIHIQVVPHIWGYGQFWRFLTWQITFTNSTEVLFAVLGFYQLRVIERLWGSRKFASFLISTLPYTTLLPPLILTLVLRPLTFGRINHLPAGPTPIIFALLANYYAAIPYTYRYRISPYSSSPSPSSAPSNAGQSGPTTAAAGASASSIWQRSITLTSKSTSYLAPLQLALSQFPGSLLAAAVGWAIGTAYRRDVLPYATTAWRVPGWIVGEERKRGFEGLRARLDAEREREGGASGLASGILAGETGEAGEAGEARRRGAGAGGQQQQQRRTLGEMVAEQFRGRG